jgi:CRP-like cAMP-binding protein
MDWSVLASLPPDERRTLAAGLRRRAYRRDEVIVHQGDPANTLHLIAAGHASVRVTLPGGQFVVVGILGPGDAFGERALVGEPSSRGATVVALERCETRRSARTSSSASDGLSGRRPVPGRSAGRRVDLNTYLLETLFVPAERRVLRRLLELCELYPADGQGIVIPVTQETLASLAGTTRPTANQVLRRLVAGGMVTVSRSQIVVLNRAGLRQRAGQAG